MIERIICTCFWVLTTERKTVSSYWAETTITTQCNQIEYILVPNALHNLLAAVFLFDLKLIFMIGIKTVFHLISSGRSGHTLVPFSTLSDWSDGASSVDIPDTSTLGAYYSRTTFSWSIPLPQQPARAPPPQISPPILYKFEPPCRHCPTIASQSICTYFFPVGTSSPSSFCRPPIHEPSASTPALPKILPPAWVLSQRCMTSHHLAYGVHSMLVLPIAYFLPGEMASMWMAMPSTPHWHESNGSIFVCCCVDFSWTQWRSLKPEWSPVQNGITTAILQ